ncbi:molybdopterin dinucleotide-binding region [Gordonia neofelifaecis NRRL B-59395]|uniref:Molybdopterin dinucleotide-binding region n=3 Tax=Gordonia TaxID=2053 RepID=F1YEJ6_9ACTN|nr:molybdopterin dinucleotide-binding region [Gordonia neofelifaecis NRRL B-59395]
MANADCIVLMGGNMAEAHPVGFQWVAEARARGARVIHVDPRFTRTSAVVDRHIAIRAGSDIVLLGGLINYAITHDRYFREYVVAYTNAATLVDEDFRDTDDLDGLFSGFDEESGTYDQSTWQYAGGRDETLQDPRTVFQILKKHYARYTPQMVAQMCGIDETEFDYLARALTDNSGPERTGCFAYATGWTQHTMGAQVIRTAAVLQLLLGNIGRPGGGVMALRGHASIQGSTDIPTLFNLLPGYLPMPSAGKHDRLDQYLDAVRPASGKGFWEYAEDYTVSLLKAWWGDAATADNDWCYDYLPRLDGPAGTYQTVVEMLEGNVDGYFVVGQNPAVGSANSRQQRMAMAQLKWLVVRDLNMIESATWWKDGPEIASGELRTEDIGTEVFFLPAATHVEKSGSFTQTQRMVQWRHQAVAPPGDAQSELDFYFELGVRIRERLAGSTDPRDRPLLDLTWDYPVNAAGDVDPESVLAEINGRYLTGPRAGEPLESYTQLRADGSTIAGCWIYTGVYADGVNQAARRTPQGGPGLTQSEWGWVWPADRRILYNRASADPRGRPWSDRKKYMSWDADAGRWVGPDVPDFPVDRAPGSVPSPDATGADAIGGDDAFIMQADGKGWLFAPTGLVDGPLPAHYEAQESPVRNALYMQQQAPTRLMIPREDNLDAPSAGEPGVDVYPYVFTTYRLTEHHTAGGMSRWSPYLAELQPEMFCEVSPELAAECGLVPQGWATIISPRGAIEARVLVTDRMRPLEINGRVVHQVGLPYHWGAGTDAVVTGDAANDLVGVTMDPNVFIQESKVGSCAVIAGRRPRGAALERLVHDYQRRAGSTMTTDNIRLTPREEE